MPDYDPLTISDEELKALPPAERGAVYKARAVARAGGAVPAPAASAPAASAPAASAPAASAPAASAPAASAPAAPKPAAPPAPTEPEKPKEPPFVQHVLESIP